MSVLGLGSLTWYYANNMTGKAAQESAAKRIGEPCARRFTALPSIGRIDPPPLPPVPPMDCSPAGPDGDHLPVPASVAAEHASRKFHWPMRRQCGCTRRRRRRRPEQLAQQRSCRVGVRERIAQSGSAASPGRAQGAPRSRRAAVHRAVRRFLRTGELAPPCGPRVAASSARELLPAQRLLLPKGAFIDCTLETAIDSTLPGMTTCIIATDTFGVDGKVVLLERGTKLIGETRGQVQQGTARVFVLWTEARTPAGVVVPLDSPGADELGRVRSARRGQPSLLGAVRCGDADLRRRRSRPDQSARSSSGGTVIVDPSASHGSHDRSR